jgi:hypothetical protein
VDRPAWGGWSGRFTADRLKNVWSRHKDVKADEARCADFFVHTEVADAWTDPRTGKRHESIFAPVWRWRRAMFNEFRARMDWCVKPYAEANHNPVAAFGGEAGGGIVRLSARAGGTVELDASGSRDPDGDGLRFSWRIYPEAGTYGGTLAIPDPAARATSLALPADSAGSQVHVVLEVADESEVVPLSAFRRIVIDVGPGR